MKYYINPKSLTFWVGMFPIVVGIFIGSEPLHGLTDYVESLKNMVILSPAMLIQSGLGWIGVRAAIEGNRNALHDS